MVVLHVDVAVGLHAALTRQADDGRASFVMSTAHPAKFKSLVESETGAKVVEAPFGESPDDPYCTVKPSEATRTVRTLLSTIR